MNVKSFTNDVGIAVNVDLDLVDVVGELPAGRTVLRFGGEWVTLGGAYSDIEPQVTAPHARRSPLPPPPTASEPPPPPENPPPHTEEPPARDNANDGGAESAAEPAPNP
ncbi:MAG TPA: hypothetical protein VF077_12740 [Nitrospiraceae bacterium]